MRKGVKHNITRTIQNFPKIFVDDIVLAKQTPVMKYWSTAKVLEMNKKEDRVKIHWIDSKYDEELPYDADLFSTI